MPISQTLLFTSISTKLRPNTRWRQPPSPSPVPPSFSLLFLFFNLISGSVNPKRNQIKFLLGHVHACRDLLLCDPAHGVLEAASRVVPGRPAAPPGAPPPVQGACDGLVDPLQLVLAYLQPATARNIRIHQPIMSSRAPEGSPPHVLTRFSLGCPCCLRSTARLFICSMASLAIAM